MLFNLNVWFPGHFMTSIVWLLSLNSARNNEMWLNLKKYHSNSDNYTYRALFVILLNSKAVTSMLKWLHL